MRSICLILAVLSAACNVPLRVGEVSRAASPSGRVDAIVIEANTGSQSSSSHDIFIVPSGKEHNAGVHVASLYGATRNPASFGVNLKWNGPEELSIEYLKATAAEIMQERAEIDGERVRVTLREGIEDPQAPAGIMLDNLKRSGQ